MVAVVFLRGYLLFLCSWPSAAKKMLLCCGDDGGLSSCRAVAGVLASAQ
jgi:hypothetical protein